MSEQQQDRVTRIDPKTVGYAGAALAITAFIPAVVLSPAIGWGHGGAGAVLLVAAPFIAALQETFNHDK